MKLNIREIKILSVFIAVWGIFLIGNGIVMSGKEKTITKVRYSLDVSEKKISQTQAKKNEIILRDFVIEVNNPISSNVKDYLVDADKLNPVILEKLELDTSDVNINQPGTYNYSVKYNKKKYQGQIVIKEKELPDMTFTLKSLSFETGKFQYSNDVRIYINESISDEEYENIKGGIEIDFSQVKINTQGDYKYYLIYKNTKYEGTISIRDKGPSITLPSASECPDSAEEKNNTCVCKDPEKQYDPVTKSCTLPKLIS